VFMLESLRVSSWADEIQLKRELPALSGEMWKSQMWRWTLKFPRIKMSGEFGRSSGQKVEAVASS